MKDYLAIITKIIAEHQTIREHIKLIGDSVADREALTSLEKVSADWVTGQPGMPAKKQLKLQQAINALSEGLKNHFIFEEAALPPLLGELFMRALVLEHREIIGEIDEAKAIVAEAKLEGLSREDLLHQESHMQQMINSICLLVEEHATKEEAVLDMVKRGLEDKRQSRS